jgi:dihydroorotate dehydrogenase (NAD+) catalytic subunit
VADLTTDLGFLCLKNPVVPASGTFGYGEEFCDYLHLDQLGAFVVKGVYRDPRTGNPPPRIHETPSGLLNSIGLAGPGCRGLADILRRVAARTSTPIVVNVCGGTDDEYLEVSEFFDAMPEVSVLELNISCPNVHAGGSCPAQDPRHTERLVTRVRRAVSLPLMVKLSPNVADIAEVARAAQAGGADALSLVNTFLGLAVDLERRAPVFANTVAGLSGPAIKPLALRLVWETCAAVSIPVMGIGGIHSGRDALEFIMAGAHAIQTGTVNLVEPGASLRIIREINAEMERLGIRDLTEIRGAIS